MGKKKVKSSQKIQYNVSNDKNIVDNFKVVINSSEWLKSCVIKEINFSNKYHDYKEMAQTLTKVMTEVIFDIQQNGFDIFNKNSIYYQRNHHCHIIDGEKKEIVKKILDEIYTNKLDIDSDEEKKLWQYGVTSGLRIICLYDQANCLVHPLFIDPYHLIYPSEKYNEKDVMKNSFCPIESFII
ncbi:hypothetical protein [Staphylococcus equorum]|uniref:hypothetical protein n=1 Tax=Staphylococcus equorum TaxID=246432 RepID=UPI0037DA7827